MINNHLDEPERLSYLKDRLKNKRSLYLLYIEFYNYFLECMKSCPDDGISLELGSGGGFLKDYNSEFITSDIIEYENIDKVINATSIPYGSNQVKIICMLNVLHHITDAELFFYEAERCLMPGGKIVIIDQHIGIISKPILKYFHHEPFNQKTRDWKFISNGPLSTANGALPWIIFKRDIDVFKKKFPKLCIKQYVPHTPLRYWFTGGLKKWNILPEVLFKFATFIDQTLIKITEDFGSFTYIEIQKKL